MTNFEMVKEFHYVFAPHLVGAFPTAGMPENITELRIALIQEELDELRQAMMDKDIIGIADAYADLLYVTYGGAITNGINIDEVFKEVHRSNMSKLGEDGKPILRADGKVLKGPNYSPPDIKAVLDRQFLRD